MHLEKITIAEKTRVEYSSNELLFLAKSGQPYRGSLYVGFDSIGESFDTLAFKRYITSLRAKRLYAEDIAFTIYTKIAASIQTENLGVIVELSSRGGIAQRLSYGDTFTPHKKNNIFGVS